MKYYIDSAFSGHIYLHLLLFLFFINEIESFSIFPSEMHGGSPLNVRGAEKGHLMILLSRLGLTLISLYKNNERRTGQ